MNFIFHNIKYKMSEEFTEKKHKKNNNKYQIKNKYRDSFEEHWVKTRLEFMFTSGQKYDEYNKPQKRDAAYENTKKIAMIKAMKKFDDKKEKIFEEYINARIADDEYLLEIGEIIESTPQIKDIDKKIVPIEKTMYSVLGDE